MQKKSYHKTCRDLLSFKIFLMAFFFKGAEKAQNIKKRVHQGRPQSLSVLMADS